MWFIDELKKLQQTMPRIALVSSNSENSDYTNYAYKNKNCYLIFGGHYCEDTHYSQYPFKTKDCTDCDKLTQSELCYECVFGSNLYDCNYLYNCFTCANCEFGFDLVNCRDCFLCANLRNVQYHIRNKQFSKDDYFQEIEKLKQYSAEQLLEELERMRRSVPHVASLQKNCENCTGSFLENSRNLTNCFYCTDVEDCIYMGTNIDAAKDSMDCDCIGYDPSELLYECIGNSGNHNCNFCNACWHNSDLEYCDMVFNSRSCFGCVSRSHAEYEILNKKYSKEEYERKVQEIKDELRAQNLYGKWLLESTHPYEDTVAELYYPS
ncbi:MAG: hypothetical protein ABII07_00530 [Patescibacteria group bacterium]|nr:hypothetical protein [Patescibacteria group bacterium]